MEFHDPLESCPYNILHRIRRSRMQFHVTTCAQNHRHLTGMIKCPFDARHVIKQIEFEHHKRTCPARALVIDYALHDTLSHPKLRILPIDVNPVGRWDERWDDDPDVRTYDPIQYIKNKPIVYSLVGVSKTRRRNHRMQERIRYRRVLENGGGDVSQNRFYSRSKSTSSKFSTRMKVVHEIGDSADEGEKPLRPPSNFLTDHSTDKTFHNYTQQSSESSGYTNPERLSSSSPSKFDQSSNRSYSSVAALSSSQRTSSSRKSSDDQWVSEKSPIAIVENSDQEVNSIHSKGSIISSENDYQFNQYQSKSKKNFSTPDADDIVSSEDDYQFNQYHSKDKQKFSTFHTSSIVPSKDNDQNKQYHSKDQENSSTSDKNSVVSSMDNYRFIPYQAKGQENSSNSDTDSIISSNDDYQIHQNHSTVQGKCSMSDTISIISGKGKYQVYQHHRKDQKKLSLPDTVSVASSKEKYQYISPLARTSSESSLSSSSSFSETSNIDSVFSCEEDELEMQKLSKTIEEIAENDQNSEEFLINDTFNNPSSERQYIIAMMNGNSDGSPLSSEEETFNTPLSNGIGHSKEHSINSIEINSSNDVSIFDKLSKTIEDLAMDSKDYKKKSELLDQEINKLKKLPSRNKSKQASASVNLKKGKLFPKCAANFLNLKE